MTKDLETVCEYLAAIKTEVTRLAAIVDRPGRAASDGRDHIAIVPMLLWCPRCGERHIDVGGFAANPHHTHACQICGLCWRPAIVHTCGVRFLPGFKNEETR